MSIFTELPIRLYPPDALKDFTADPAYRPQNARAMIWLAQLAYENPNRPKFDNILTMWGLARVKHASLLTLPNFGLGDTFGFVAANDSAVIVAFRGTDPLLLSNWIVDFSTEVTADGVHRGFAEAARSIWAVLKDDTGQALDARPGAKLVFTGHSLGAAMAAIAAATSETDATAVYTFGMPRTGTASFGAQYNRRLGDRTFRLVYGNDIVPMVQGEPFHHIGRYLHSKEGVFDPRELTEDPQLLPQEQWSDDPRFVKTLQEAIASFESHPVSRIAELLLAGKPESPRDDAVGLLLSLLPPPLRDHIPDRYWGDWITN